MILADKIIALRKKAGWSQDELAQKLGVTRQSVSKWEGAQSVPDMERIVQLSRLFGVTTDFLLKDELEAEEYSPAEPDTQLRRVTMAAASSFLSLRKADAPKIALAVLLCIISPIALILLAGLSQSQYFAIGEDAAAGVGLCVLIVIVAIAVVIFIRCAQRAADYEYLKTEPFETEYGVVGMVKERRHDFRESKARMDTAGTVLCILSVLPLFAAVAFARSDIYFIIAVCLLLLIAALGCYAFVCAGVYESAMKKLLEEGEYSPENKKKSALFGAVTTAYWLVVTAVYLLCTFGPSGNGQPGSLWYIWAIAGVLYGAVVAFMNIAKRSHSGK